MAFFSVLIVNYHSSRVLRRALASLEKQSFRDFEVLVLDNAGDDRPDVVRLSSENFVIPVHFDFAEKNIGFAAGINRIAGRAGSDWLVLLNPDAVARPNWLEIIHGHCLNDHGVDMYASLQLDLLDPTRLDGAGDRYSAFGLAWRRGYGRCLDDLDVSAGEVLPCGASAVYRRSAFLAVGGFCERFFCYLEDVDLALRLTAAGSKSRMLSDAVVLHEGGVSSGGRSSDYALIMGLANLPSVYVRNMPIAPAVLFAPLFMLALVGLVGRNILRGQGKAAWMGLGLGIARSPVAWKERRSVRKNAKKSILPILVFNPIRALRRL